MPSTEQQRSASRAFAIGSRGGWPDADRGLRPDRRPPDRGARRPQRLDRLALLPALRLRRLLRRSARQRGERTLAARSGLRGRTCGAALPRQLARARARLPHRGRLGARDRLHAAAWRRSGRRPHRRGARRDGSDADAARDPLRLRLDRALGAQHLGRLTGRDRRPGRRRAADARRDPRREPPHRRGVHGLGRGAHPVHAHVVPLAPRHRRAGRPGAGARGHVLVLARMARPVHVLPAAGATRSSAR